LSQALASIPLATSLKATETVRPLDPLSHESLSPEDVVWLKALFELLASWEEIGQ